MNGIDPTALTDTIMTLVTTWGLKLLGGLVALLAGRMAAGWLRRIVERAMQGSKMEPTLVSFFSRLTYYGAMAFVIIMVLGVVGIETASLAVLLGAAGLAVGMALQGTLSHFAAGVMLMIFRPIHIGDFVEVGGVSGTVSDIGVFRTILDTPDNVQIVVPNSNVLGCIEQLASRVLCQRL